MFDFAKCAVFGRLPFWLLTTGLYDLPLLCLIPAEPHQVSVLRRLHMVRVIAVAHNPFMQKVTRSSHAIGNLKVPCPRSQKAATSVRTQHCTKENVGLTLQGTSCNHGKTFSLLSCSHRGSNLKELNCTEFQSCSQSSMNSVASLSVNSGVRSLIV